MKKHIILILLLGIALEAFSQQQPEEVYYPLPENKKFEGTYIFDDGQQRFVMTLNNRKQVRLKKGDHRFFNLLEGNISYTKNGKTIMTRTKGDHHVWGGLSGENDPNVMRALFKDPERSQAGTITLTLDPKNNTVVFKLKKNPGGVYVVTDEASRQLAEQIMRSHSRPLAIPDSLVLKKQ